MKRFNQINMIPFIDIMLVLLAIVLTTATFVSQGLIDVNLPKAQKVAEPAAANPAETLEIAVNDQEELFFQGEQIQWIQLQDKLSVIPNEQFIVLRIDKHAPFERFIQLLDPLKAGEFNNLSIQAEQS